MGIPPAEGFGLLHFDPSEFQLNVRGFFWTSGFLSEVVLFPWRLLLGISLISDNNFLPAFAHHCFTVNLEDFQEYSGSAFPRLYASKSLIMGNPELQGSIMLCEALPASREHLTKAHTLAAKLGSTSLLGHQILPFFYNLCGF